MARTEWIAQRLANWARWRLTRGGGALGYAGVNLADPNAGRDGYAETVVPTSDVEAADTEDAVQRLPSELRATVTEYYLGAGGLELKLRRLCIAKATLHKRLDQADRLLAEHFTARQDAARAERQRVESLQQGARARVQEPTR